MPRLFVAADVPESQHEALLRLRDNTLEARWTPAEQYHLTLQFIGDVSEERAGTIQAALADVRAIPITMESTGLTVFPSIRNPRVLVARLMEAPALTQLQHAVATTLYNLGTEAETRPFRPHVTVARLKRMRPREVRAYLHTHSDFRLPPCTVAEIHLYESILQPSGAGHEKRATYGLQFP